MEHQQSPRARLPRSPARTLLRGASRLSPVGARALALYDGSARTGARRGWPEAASLLSGVRPTRISVDVFDTLLTRRVVGDQALWWVLGTTLARDGVWHEGVDTFVRARRAASQARPHGTLEDIYAELVLADHCPPVEGAAAEHAVERSLTVPLEGAREGLERLRAHGHRLTFVSDMHLSREHLWACLRDHGLTSPADELVISSEIGAAKWDGTLFPLLVQGQHPSIAWHIGNDVWSDVAMAERAGVRALPVRRGEATELERTMAGPAGSAGASIAAAALAARCGAATSGPAQDALWEVGADVGGQCLSAFLLWIRKTCDELGVRHVLFLARDGELPLRMAQAMPTDHWRGFVLSYLHGNRRMWSVAAAGALGVDAWLTAGTADASGFLRQGEKTLAWGSLLGRLALWPDDLTGAPHLAGLRPDQPLPADLTADWHRLLLDPAVRQTIADRAERQYADLQEHLAAQGVGAGPVAVVDVGWRGQLAWHISAVLRGLTSAEPVHLHFGGVDIATSEAGQVDIRRFAVDDSREPLPFPDVISCVETITASGAARARTIERGPDGAVRLVFDPALPQMDTEDRREMWRAAVAVAAALPSPATLSAWGVQTDGLDREVRAVLSKFWLTPTPVHALAAAHLAAEVDDAGADVHPVARAYPLPGRRDTQGRTWRQGSLQLTTPVLRAALTALLRVRDGRRLS